MASSTPSADAVYGQLNSQVGYHEGSNNYNIFAAYVGVPNNQAWCTTFVSWGFKKAGFQSLCLMSDYSVDQYNWFNARGRASGYPAVGAVVWLGPGGGDHTAFVYKYDADYIYTVEGNWNDQVQLMVRPRRTSGPGGLSIFQYGYPNYSEGIISANPNTTIPGSRYQATASLTLPGSGGGTGGGASPSALPWVSYQQIHDAASSSSGVVGTEGTPQNSRDDVLNFQQGLKYVYPSYSYSAESGVFGSATHSQTATFQASKGFTSDGIPGPLTTNALSDASGYFQVRDLPDGTSHTPAVNNRTDNPTGGGTGGGTGAATTYTVKSGDTMSQIAVNWGITLQALEDANPQVTNPDVISVGQVLNIPAGNNGTGNGTGGGTGGTGGTGTPGAITWSQMTGWNLKGTFSSGDTACRNYTTQALQIMGLPVTTAWLNGMATIASRESASNSPSWQINTTDSNAKNVPELFNGGNAPDGYPGQCSRGGWQCIPQTFCTYHAAGTTTSIYDPVANVAAAINYVRAVYGVASDGSNLASKVQQADPNRPPAGY